MKHLRYKAVEQETLFSPWRMVARRRKIDYSIHS
jgi:hypothetical protein